MISFHTAMTSPTSTTIPAGSYRCSTSSTSVAIGAFFYFDHRELLSLSSVNGKCDQLLTFTMSGLLAMLPTLYKIFANKPI